MYSKNKYIFFLLIFLLNYLHLISQKDSTMWHFGFQANYQSCIYPDRAPYLYYKYSYAGGISVFTEKQFKKNKTISWELNLGYKLLKFNANAISIDSTVYRFHEYNKNIPYAYSVYYEEKEKKYNKISFLYHNLNAQVILYKKIKNRLKIGVGLDVNYYLNLDSYNKKNPVYSYPAYFFHLAGHKNGSYVLDKDIRMYESYNNVYSYSSVFNVYFLTYIGFKLKENQYLSLSLSLNPYSYSKRFKYIKDNSLDPVYRETDSRNLFFRTGPIYEKTNFITISYKYYFK